MNLIRHNFLIELIEGDKQMIIQIVRFKSGLREEQVIEKYNARAPRYRELKGLLQKYYLKYPETDEYGAVYLWETESALKEFQESELGQTIPTSYKIQGNPQVRMAEVIMTLHDIESIKT